MLLNKLFLSSTVRFAAVYMALFGASVLLLFAFVYWATAGYLERQARAVIETDAAGLMDRYRSNGGEALKQSIARRVAKTYGKESVYLLADRDGKVLAGNLDEWPAGESGSNRWLNMGIEDYDAEEEGEEDEHWALAYTAQLSGGLRLLVGRDARELEEEKEHIMEALGWAFVITLVLGLAGGVAISVRMLRRIEAINETSRKIISGDLFRRIPIGGSGDEFDQLAQNLNAMLDQIQMLMDGIRQVSDNIAHDLRGSLTRLRGQLDVLQTRSTGSDADRAIVDKVVKEADGLLATFNALLRIARIEARGRRAGFSQVDLKTVILDVVELYEPLITEKGQNLEVKLDEGLTIPGDRDLLFQAFANLLDNATKYMPDNGRIDVELGRSLNDAWVVVADTGRGIPKGARDKVFQRFFRLEEGREVSGSGLGLSLVAAVVKLHHGAIQLEDNDPGLRVKINFPIQNKSLN
ncbi:MAG: ATP-binding protein [Nitrospinales bacterium]